jgi:glycosyltransferase involved in cell wall biosynthesis
MIVVDDGSSDRSSDVVSAFAAGDPRIRLIRQRNCGVAAARNRGVERSSHASEFLLFLDADDCLRPTMLERFVSYFDTHYDVGAAHCGWQYVDDLGHEVEPESPRLLPRFERGRWGLARPILDTDPRTPFEAIFCAAGLAPSMVVIRRSLYAQTSGWDEDFGQPAEDTHLFLQLALLAPIHYLGLPLVDYRLHGTQSTVDTEHLGRQWERLLARWASYDTLPAEQGDIVRRAWLFRERQYTARTACGRVAYELRRGNVIAAARFGAGATRIILRSLLSGPPARY